MKHLDWNKIGIMIFQKFILIVIVAIVIGIVYGVICFLFSLNFSPEMWLILIIIAILIGCAIKYHSKESNGGFG